MSQKGMVISMKVIIVDDERNALENLQMKMKAIPQITGIETFWCPVSAFNYARVNPVDIAFLDIEMPEMSGIEMAERLKRVNPWLNIVFVTAYDNYAREAFEVKACDYITKPATIDSIQDAIKNLRHPVSDTNERVWIQMFPFFHRSADFRDSEGINYENVNISCGERVVYEHLIRSGIAYERGDLNTAHKFALSANSRMKDDFSPETKFSSFMILAAVLNAQNQNADLSNIFKSASAMIERHKAYYLKANLHAFKSRLKLAEGDLKEAENWLKNDATSPYNDLPFHKLYQHFVTARAYIVTGDFNTAVTFLKKLRTLCEQYNRILDMIEVDILLAIAFWNKARIPHNVAFASLTKAITAAGADGNGYKQLFTNEGSELLTMLHKLHKRVIQRSYDGELCSNEIKTLYVLATAAAKVSKGMTGGRISANLTFTEKQKLVMRLMCEGFSRNEIAEKMELKPNGVKSHVELIYRKLDVTNNVEAVLRIKELGVL